MLTMTHEKYAKLAKVLQYVADPKDKKKGTVSLLNGAQFQIPKKVFKLTHKDFDPTDTVTLDETDKGTVLKIGSRYKATFPPIEPENTVTVPWVDAENCLTRKGAATAKAKALSSKVEKIQRAFEISRLKRELLESKKRIETRQEQLSCFGCFDLESLRAEYEALDPYDKDNFCAIVIEAFDDIAYSLEFKTESLKELETQLNEHLQQLKPQADTTTHTVEVPALNLIENLKRVFSMALRDNNTMRFSLTGVHWCFKATDLRLEATNGYRLGIAQIPTKDEQAHKDVEFLMAPDDVKTLLKSFTKPKDHEFMAITFKGNTLTVGCDGVELSYTDMDLEYPDVDRVIPKEHTFQATFDHQALSDAVKQASLTTVEESGAVVFYGDDKGQAWLYSSSLEKGKTLIPLQATLNGDVGISLRYEYILDTLKAFKGSAKITMYGTDAESATIWEESDLATGFIGVQMPIRLDYDGNDPVQIQKVKLAIAKYQATPEPDTEQAPGTPESPSTPEPEQEQATIDQDRYIGQLRAIYGLIRLATKDNYQDRIDAALNIPLEARPPQKALDWLQKAISTSWRAAKTRERALDKFIALALLDA